MALLRLLGSDPIFNQAKVEMIKVTPLVQIRAASWEKGTRGTVHIFTGRTEYIEKYAATIQNLVTRKFNVTVHDWRGQGLSTRNTEFPKRGYIEDFADYQSDSSAVISHYAHLPGPHFILAHSMGGAIALRYIKENKNIRAVIFSAPMWGIELGRFMQLLSSPILKTMYALGKEMNVAIGTKEIAYELYEEFKGNLLTSDETQWNLNRERLQNYPELELGGPTYAWLNFAFEQMSRFPSYKTIKIPALVGLGSEEKVVAPASIRKICKLQENFRLVEIEGAKHEIFCETPEIQAYFWKHIDMFLSQFD